MSKPLPCGTPSTTSTRTTSPSSFSARFIAQLAPTLPPPTTVIFLRISCHCNPLRWILVFRILTILLLVFFDSACSRKPSAAPVDATFTRDVDVTGDGEDETVTL